MNADSTPLGQIAVVDDTAANLHLLSTLLENAGYDVRPFPRGAIALEGIIYSPPDLILLDIQMPEMNGYELCQKLKANETTENIPVIFISALNETFDKVKAFQVGGVDYITKPFQTEEVLARVMTHIELYQIKKQLQTTNIAQAEQLVAQNAQLLHLNQSLEQANQELQCNYEKLKQAQLQLVQTEKMAALGNLVTGVAHEINNPIGFLSGSINNAKDYLKDLLDYVALYQQHHPNPAAPVQDKAEDIDLEFLSKDLPKLLHSMKGATDRIKGISTSLRTFSRADTEHTVSANLHDSIDSTIFILKYRLKANEHRPEIKVIQDYGDIPAIDCFPGQLNQVFMNILANAIDMFDEMAQNQSIAELEAHPQQITIRTTADANQVQIQITDNGKGMTEAVRARIFDYLFTTKGVGKGTGLGLAIARQIVVEKHGGSLEVQSELGRGTTFCIRLPITG